MFPAPRSALVTRSTCHIFHIVQLHTNMTTTARFAVTVLPHLMSEGAAGLLDELYVEWHPDDDGLQRRATKAFGLGEHVFGHTKASISPLVGQLKKSGIRIVGSWP